MNFDLNLLYRIICPNDQQKHKRCKVINCLLILQHNTQSFHMYWKYFTFNQGKVLFFMTRKWSIHLKNISYQVVQVSCFDKSKFEIYSLFQISWTKQIRNIFLTYGQPGNNHVLRKLYNCNLIMDLYPYETFLCNIKIPDKYKWYLHIDLKF